MSGTEGLPSASSTCEYLQPIPLRGTGFHRYVLIMLQHNTYINFQPLLPEIDPCSLSSRTFCFADFYKHIESQVTPVGIHFFQSEWDESVKDVFYQKLDMKEPAYQYDFPEKVYKTQKKYPLNSVGFQTYLDRYRDRRDLKEEVLKEHLSETSPFLPPEVQRAMYPLATPTKKGLYPDKLPPTWILNTKRNKALGIHKYKYVNSEQ